MVERWWVRSRDVGGRRIKGTKGERSRWDREKSDGWIEARSWLRANGAEGERKKRRRDTPRGKDEAGDRKTVIGSESEDKYNDSGL